MTFRIGISYDVHNLIKGKQIILAGLSFDFNFSIQAHSDGDVILHAISEAIMGALGIGDLGTHFPDNSLKNKNLDSKKILAFSLDKMKKNKMAFENVDLTLISNDFFVSKNRKLIEDSLKELLSCKNVNIKGTTWEKKSKQIACQCVVLLKKIRK